MTRFTVFTIPIFLIFAACSSTQQPLSLQESTLAPPLTTTTAPTITATPKPAPITTVAKKKTPPTAAPIKTLLLDHKYFKIYYDPDLKMPRYVVYTLTKDQMQRAFTKRQDRFRADPLLTKSGIPMTDKKQYVGTGYDRGHMAPFKDFAWDPEAGLETFVMSNMVPQAKKLNQQAWEDLEEQVRKWACGEEKIVVITGPIVDQQMRKLSNGLAVPDRFFKVVIDETPPRKATAFIYHQTDNRKGLVEERQVTPTQVEKESQINLEALVSAQDRPLLTERSSLKSWKSENCVGIAARELKREDRNARVRDVSE